ncbi:FAD binding domain-containing protein [Kibdelosporangium philippinense]|uniref:FAD binding domain-containing protein n=1 Tax=Kibdelosporangium philippinense TaxID=211113 RepID=A0ABS8ZV10_9PSEU|nr:FAD binding domain-containing protein [Kibdelosporangium philippinense]MCE7011083.1 FAD binding domain-containing protein [Kibdelosporangium philippinense]
MKPAAVDYVRAESVAHTLALLSDVDGARVIAGGQSLVTMMNLRLARPTLLVDVTALPELARTFDDVDSVVLGTLVRQRTLETDPLLTHRLPFAADAVRHTGHVAIRNRGTLGGALAHADPSGELPLVAVVSGATIHLEFQRGRREVAAEDFFLSYYMADIEPDELLTWVRMPTQSPGQGWGFTEHVQRHGEYGIADAGALMTTDAKGRVTSVRAGLLHAADRPLLVREPADVIGENPSSEAWASVARSWVRSAEPAEDPDYIRAVAADALATSLTLAYRRAQEEQL